MVPAASDDDDDSDDGVSSVDSSIEGIGSGDGDEREGECRRSRVP